MNKIYSLFTLYLFTSAVHAASIFGNLKAKVVTFAQDNYTDLVVISVIGIAIALLAGARRWVIGALAMLFISGAIIFNPDVVSNVAL